MNALLLLRREPMITASTMTIQHATILAQAALKSRERHALPSAQLATSTARPQINASQATKERMKTASTTIVARSASTNLNAPSRKPKTASVQRPVLSATTQLQLQRSARLPTTAPISSHMTPLNFIVFRAVQQLVWQSNKQTH